MLQLIYKIKIKMGDHLHHLLFLFLVQFHT